LKKFQNCGHGNTAFLALRKQCALFLEGRKICAPCNNIKITKKDWKLVEELLQTNFFCVCIGVIFALFFRAVVVFSYYLNYIWRPTFPRFPPWWIELSRGTYDNELMNRYTTVHSGQLVHNLESSKFLTDQYYIHFPSLLWNDNLISVRVICNTCNTGWWLLIFD